MPEDLVYHHAEMQTEKIRKRSWSKQFEGNIALEFLVYQIPNMYVFLIYLELVNRGVQTQPTFSKYAQTCRDVSTQTAVPGVHLSTKNDYTILGTDYRTAYEFRKVQVKAVSLLSLFSFTDP